VGKCRRSFGIKKSTSIELERECHDGLMPGTSAGPPHAAPPPHVGVAEQRGPLVHALFRISRKNRAMAAEYLRPLGLYPGQELLLLQLPDGERRSQQELVDALGLDHSTVTKMLQRLERAGVVARHQSAQDRRVVLVELTADGRAHRRAVEQMWARMEEATSGALSERQRAQLLGLLRRVEAHLDQYPGQHSGGQHSGGQHSGGQHSGGQHSGGQHSGGQHSDR